MKRNGLKKMFLGVAAGAMMLTSMAMGASAATTYTGVTANLYVPSSANVVKLWNAYFTSTNIPPITKASNNATAIVGDNGTITLSLPITNGIGASNAQGLALLKDSTNTNVKSTDGKAELKLSDMTNATADIGCTTASDGDGDSHIGLKRYTEAVFEITDTVGQTSFQFTFPTLKYHAKINKGIINNDSIETTKVVLEFDLSTGTASSSEE